MKDGRLFDQAYRAMEEARKAVDELYARWAELEEKPGNPIALYYREAEARSEPRLSGYGSEKCYCQ